MAKLPDPPARVELEALGPDVVELPAGARLWRVYFQAGAHPTTWSQLRAFGPTHARFDHHLDPPRAQGREILYATLGRKGAVTAIAEVFQATRTVERAARAPALVAFDLTREVRLLDLTGTWPTRAGASVAISSGPKHRARQWSRAIYEAYPDIEGLLYGSSMNANEPCVALYERASSAVPALPAFHRLLSDPAMLSRLKAACQAMNYLLL